MERNKGLWIIAIYLFLAVYLLPMFPHGGSANELTRWATAASIVEKGSFEISWTESLIGPNVDTARINNQTFSNKPPGTAVLAVPFYALTRVFIGPPTASNIRVSWFVMRFFLSTLPLFLLAAWLYSRDSDGVSLATLLFATPLFVYSLLFFSHVLVAVLLYLAFRLLFDTERIFLRNCFLAGLICGLAVTCEFPAVVPVAVFGGGLLFADRRNEFRRRLLVFFIGGGLPFAVLLIIYNYSVFGSPFALSYAYESFPEWAEVAGQGVFGISFPTLSNIYLLLLSPSRGLFFYAPMLILPVVVFITSRERRTLRHRVKVAAVLMTILVMCGHGAAHGGWAFGARYLVLILPLMLDSYFDGEIDEYSNVWQGFLFAVSFVLCTLPALTFSFAPPEFAFPHNDFWGKFLFSEGWFTPNVSNIFGVSAGFWSTVPVILALLCVIWFSRNCARRPKRFTIGLLLGLIVASVYCVVPGLDNNENAFRRATIAERFYKPANRLDEFRSSQTPARVNGFEWTIAETRAFAPDDFPYLPTRDFKTSPSGELRKAIVLQQQGRIDESEAILKRGRDDFSFAQCEFTTNLAVIYYMSDRKDAALSELESVQNLVTNAARPDCLRSQFLLGLLYRERGDEARANQTLKSFLTNSAGSTDAQIRSFRQQLGIKD